ncbi:hypothetical protein Godav_025640 [Gossypium davidsonii]|uniref:Uncharacterized protein n=1 Tax=Gossypium davidsonii TaxID=34287 RepID=A0A7J8TIU3_GOSDV|nr:hypothetical protein [Gossypium davidsonii]
MLNFLSDDDGGNESRSFEDCNTKKVRIKNGPDEAKVDMVVDLEPSPNMSWKDILLKAGLTSSDKDLIEFGGGSNGVLTLLEGAMDYLRPIPDGPTMDQRFLPTSTIPECCNGLDQYGHVKEMCLSLAVNPVSESKKVATTSNLREYKIGAGKVVEMAYGSWIMVERKS